MLLFTFAFLVVFVPSLFPRVCILIINKRLELETWVLFCFVVFFVAAAVVDDLLYGPTSGFSASL